MANEELDYSGRDGQNRGVSKNYRHLARVGVIASAVNPVIITDVIDIASIASLSHNVTSFTTNLSGTPNDGDELCFAITDDGSSKTISWGSSFEASDFPLPTVTVSGIRLDIYFKWNAVTSKWRCVYYSFTPVTLAGTQTLLNKRVTKRAPSVTQSATPTINTDVTDVAHITGLAQNITSFTTNLTGTPVQGDTLRIDITDNGTARTIAWGASFESSGGATLPTTTVLGVRLDIGFVWNTVTSKWRCIAVV